MTRREAENHPHRFSAEGDFIERLEGPERSALIPRDVIIPRMHLTESDTLADLGSGIGYFSLPIAKLVKSVISVDLEPKMHEVLSSRMRAEGTNNIDMLRASITDLPIAGGSVDRVLAAFVYHEVDNPKGLMSEAFRVLRKDGVLTIIDFQKRETVIGPPMSERKTPEQVIRSAPKGFESDERDESEVYYQLSFRKGFQRPGRDSDPSPELDRLG
jgi:ubiquinone/menaquinone biosynthesis C-methylase UbiE